MNVFYSQVDPMVWHEMQFATGCVLGEAFMLRPNELFYLDSSLGGSTTRR